MKVNSLYIKLLLVIPIWCVSLYAGSSRMASSEANNTLQTRLVSLSKQYRHTYQAKKVLIAVMDAKTAQILAFAASEAGKEGTRGMLRKYWYEPGAAMMPVVMAMAMDREWIVPGSGNDIDGRVDPGKEGEERVPLTPDDIIAASLNGGIVQVASRLSTSEMHEGLQKFHLGRGTEQISLKKLQNKRARASLALGYGLQVTPLQMLKAYSVFVNKGIMASPSMSTDNEPKQIIDSETAQRLKAMLAKTVYRTGEKKSVLTDMRTGGKPYMSHLAKNGRYGDAYIAGFYGFAEDDQKHSYIVGIIFEEPKIRKTQEGTNPALSLFDEIVHALVESHLLGSVRKGYELQMKGKDS